MEDLYIWNEVQALFDKLVGQSRNIEFITLSQFKKLANVPFGNSNVIKADFDILFKNALRRNQTLNESLSD